MKNSLYITVDSLEGITHVDVKPIDETKGISVVMAGERIVQYAFDRDNASSWTEKTAIQYILSLDAKRSTVLQAEIAEQISQAAYLPDDLFTKLKAVDQDPFFVPIEIKYGVGSNKQSFNRAFFEKAGVKFEGKPFLFNHSGLNEFGNANPIGSIVKFAGATEHGATFIAYVSAAEGTLRQKIRESQALGDKGFVKKVSIEGIPSRSDYDVDEKTGIRHFRDLTMPTGIAIVNLEGMKGSQIIS